MPYSDEAKSGGVATRPRQALDEAGADRIDDIHEHDRHGAGRLQQRRHGRAAGCQDDVRRERDQFRRIFAKRSCIAASASACRSARCGRRSSPIAAARAGTPRCGLCPSASSAAVLMSTPMRRIRSRLLRPRRERPRRCRAAEQRDELAPSHELPSDEARNLAHHWTIRAPVHRSEIFPLMSVQGPNPDLSASARMSPSASCGHDAALALGSNMRCTKPAVSRCSNMPCAEGRVIRSPRRRGRAASAALRGRAPWRF